MTKKYWKGLEELHKTPEFLASEHNEFAEELPIETYVSEEAASITVSRRGFLKAAGFGLGAASLAACSKMPVKKALPYINQPEEIIPGVPNYYASTCSSCQSACATVVKTRDGRPIKIEGNPESPANGQGLCARGQAEILSLYDSNRIQNPMMGGKKVTWKELDAAVMEKLSQAKNSGKGVRIVSGSLSSPSVKKLVSEFVASFPGAKHIVHDANSYDAILEANEESFGQAVLPHYDFSQAKVIVSVGADFLGTWIAPVEFAKDYAKGRDLQKSNTMSYHLQIEAGMSLTGANADKRLPVAAGQYGAVLVQLYSAIAKQLGKAALASLEISTEIQKELDAVAQKLIKHQGQSLVISASQDKNVQVVVNAINNVLGNLGQSVDLNRPFLTAQKSSTSLHDLEKEMAAGDVEVLINLDSNFLYCSPASQTLSAALKKVPTKIAVSLYQDETSSEFDLIAPKSHALESWNDYEARQGLVSIGQPTFVPIYDTRSTLDTLLVWLGKSENALQYVQTNLSSRVSWKELLQKGVIQTQISGRGTPAFRANVSAASQNIQVAPAALELVLYEKVGIGEGKDANNPWLQELPDPVTKITWDNYANISPALAKEKGLAEEDLIKLTVNSQSIELPVHIQPGQAKDSISVAVGYGRKKGGKVIEKGIGQNVYPFKNFQDSVAGLTLSSLGKKYTLAATQTHHNMHGRAIVIENTLNEHLKNPHHGIPHHEKLGNVYPDRPDDNRKTGQGHAWGVAIDLNSCNGCAACLIGCQAENNVPVVGKEEVKTRREMHWLRIDRYYAGDENNPEVVHQPMFCQHCGNAPCENVCPVLATMHSNDGLNSQIYNRCVGTRYCANNCPYKVRRFNWFNYSNNAERFDYHMADDAGKLVLNPDVVVRTRGVMEKCTMCVQRIQAGRLEAKLNGKAVQDGEIKTACQQSCPTEAIVFGDLNDPQSKVSKLKKSQRNYRVLEELDIDPVVSYLTKVRNKD